MKQIDKTIILIISKVIHTANFFILSIFFARILTKSDYGTYIQATMIINLLVLVLAFGIPPSLFYFLPKKSIKHKAFILRSFILLLSIGIGAAFLMVLLEKYICNFLNNQNLAQFLPFIGISITCFMCANITQPILLVANKSLTLAVINVIKGVIFFCSMIICLFVNPQVKYLIYILTLNYFFELVIIIKVILKYSDTFDKSSDAILISIREQMRFSLPLAASGMLWLLGREIDKYIISYYLNPADLAVYARGAVEIPLIHILAGTISQIYIPQWVRLFDAGKNKELVNLWHLTIKKIALIMFPLFVLFQLISRDFILLLYSSAYSGSIVIFSIYLFSIPLQFTEYTAIMESTGKTKYISYGYMIQIPLNISLSIVLLAHIGAVGPAIATIISSYLMTAYMLFMLNKVLEYKFRKILPWKELSRTFFLSITTGIIVFVIRKALKESLIIESIKNSEFQYLTMILITVLIFITIYIFVLFKTNSIDAEDKATLYRWSMVNKLQSIYKKAIQT
jgi:O-antigen/teichoic acid export membrane protein